MKQVLVFLALIILTISHHQRGAAMPWTVGAPVELCRWTILYDAPDHAATTYHRLPTPNIAILLQAVTDANGDVWWQVERSASEPHEALSGWVKQAAVAACEPADHQFKLYVDQAQQLLQPGDIIVAKLDFDTCGLDWRCWLFTTLYGGEWGHAAMVVTRAGELQLVEATIGGGVWVVPLEQSTAYFYDHSRVLRPHAPAEVRSAAANYASTHDGKPFNYQFLDINANDAFYCSQLIWQAYHLNGGPNLDANAYFHGLGIYYDQLNRLLGTAARIALFQAITPDDLIHSSHVFIVNPNQVNPE